MGIHTIELEDTVSEFFEDIAIHAKKPVEELLSDVLFKQVKITKRKIVESFKVDEE